MKRIYQYWNKYFPYIMTAVFLAISILIISRHELWSDEAKAWNISIASSSISEFVYNMRDNYGHPFLWNAILYFISHYITGNPESMKIIHLGISTITCFLILKFAPFNKTIKTLLIFNYFIFYEYSIISRNYAIAILPIIIFCVLCKNKYKNLVFLGIALFFMTQGHLYTFILSLVFLLILIIDLIIDRRIVLKLISRPKLLLFFIIALSGILLTYWELGSQINKGTVWSPSLFTMFNISVSEIKQLPLEISKNIISALLPVPSFSINFWNSNVIITYISKYNSLFLIPLATILFIFPLFILKKNAIRLYLIGYLSLIGAISLLYGRLSRHVGILLIFLIVCFWVSNVSNSGNLNNLNNKKINVQNIFLIVILSISLVGSLTASYFDYNYPFSQSKNVAEYINNNYNKDNIIVVGYKDVDTQTIAAYLDKDIFFPQTNELGRFCLWSKRRNDVPTDEIFKSASYFIDKGRTIIVIIHSNAVKDLDLPEKYSFTKVDKKFDESIVGYENYSLFLFEN